MNSKSIFVAASVLIGSTIVNGECPDGTMTFNSANGGKTKALGVCEMIQDGSNPGSQMYVCNSNQDGVELITYSDNACQTEDGNGAADQAGNIDSYDCSSVSDCDYIHIYKWTPTDPNTCDSVNMAITANLVISDVLTSSTSGTGDLNECTGVNNGVWESWSVLECTADFEGNIIAKAQFSDDACQNQINSITNIATQSETDPAVAEDNGNGGTINYCRSLVGCSNVALAPTDSPTDAPTTAPSEAPSAEPTTAPSAAPSAEPTAAPSASPTAAPVPTEAPSAAPTAAPVSTATDAPSAAPTSATSSTTTAAPTTASSSDTVQSSSIIALLIASFYAIIA